MELHFKDNLIGYINDIYQEDYWIHGVFKPTDKFQAYKEFFRAIICEDGFDETKFDFELLDDENWRINDNGNISGIYIPAIYEDGDISFRYR